MAVSETNNTRDKYVEQVRQELQLGDKQQIGEASGELKQRARALVEVFVEETDLTHDEASWTIYRLGQDLAMEQDFLTFLEMKRLQEERGESGQIDLDDLERWVNEMREDADQE